MCCSTPRKDITTTYIGSAWSCVTVYMYILIMDMVRDVIDDNNKLVIIMVDSNLCNYHCFFYYISAGIVNPLMKFEGIV